MRVIDNTMSRIGLALLLSCTGYVGLGGDSDDLLSDILDTSTKAATAAPTSKKEAELIRFSFDDALPGAYPKGWGGSWGKWQAGHSIYISNIDSVSKNNCLVIDADKSDLPSEMFGFSTPLKNITNGWAVISFCFKIKRGSGQAVSLGFRILSGNKVAGNEISFGGKNVGMGYYSMGAWENDVWYKLTIYIPTMAQLPKGDGEAKISSLLQCQNNGKWVDVGPKKLIPFTPVTGFSNMEFIISGNNYTVFIDDITFSEKNSID